MTIALHALLLVSLNVSASPRTTKTSAAKNIAAKPSAADTAELTKLKAMAAVLQPTDVSVDISGLPAGERGALHQLVEAAKIMDALILASSLGGQRLAFTRARQR